MVFSEEKLRTRFGHSRDLTRRVSFPNVSSELSQRFEEGLVYRPETSLHGLESLRRVIALDPLDVGSLTGIPWITAHEYGPPWSTLADSPRSGSDRHMFTVESPREDLCYMQRYQVGLGDSRFRQRAATAKHATSRVRHPC